MPLCRHRDPRMAPPVRRVDLYDRFRPIADLGNGLSPSWFALLEVAMSYYFSTKIAGTFAEALDQTRNALQSEGFGVISVTKKSLNWLQM